MKNKKQTSYLNYYKECVAHGNRLIVGYGLCSEVSWGVLPQEILRIFKPTVREKRALACERLSHLYWGSGTPDLEWNIGEFTPLRQNIVLLMAALNGEL